MTYSIRSNSRDATLKLSSENASRENAYFSLTKPNEIFLLPQHSARPSPARAAFRPVKKAENSAMVAPHSEADAPAAADESAVAAVADHAKWELLRQLAAFMTFVFFVVPVAVIAIAFIFGVLLAEVEGWSIMDGFYYVTSMLCGLPTPLTTVEPDTDEGKIMDIIIAIWALAVAGTIIGVVAGMSFITRLIDSAEAAFLRKRKVDEDEATFELMDSRSETAALGNRIAALEKLARVQNETLAQILAATSK